MTSCKQEEGVILRGDGVVSYLLDLFLKIYTSVPFDRAVVLFAVDSAEGIVRFNFSCGESPSAQLSSSSSSLFHCFCLS